jgi:two-component system, cell cycle response regulator
MPNFDDDNERTNVTHLGDIKDLLNRAKRDRAYLIVLAGANVGEMHKLETIGEVIIGRSVGAAVRLADDGVSRKHARLVVEQGNVRLEDLGSANGTLVNGTRVVDACALKDGDQIQIGSTTILKFTYHDSLEEEFQRRMYEAALRDPMTKAYNKKHLSDRLDAELAFARRHNTSLALVMLDVDHFKRVNDTLGHPAGDAVLIKLAQIVQATLRTEDMFARYGGEEFAVLCRGSNLSQAAILAERIRATVEETTFEFDGTVIPVTCSLGVTSLQERPAASVLEFVGNADEALYEAKRLGRNRVVSSG